MILQSRQFSLLASQQWQCSSLDYRVLIPPLLPPISLARYMRMSPPPISPFRRYEAAHQLLKSSSSNTISLLWYSYVHSYQHKPTRDHSATPQVPSTMRRTERPKQGLWWSVTANTMQGKSVVRRWAQRRLRVALLNALEGKGWDGRGMVKAEREVRLDDQDGKKGKVKKEEKGKRDLVGTLQVHARSTILQATGDQVKKEAEVLIAIIGRKVEGMRKGSDSAAKKERPSLVLRNRSQLSPSPKPHSVSKCWKRTANPIPALSDTVGPYSVRSPIKTHQCLVAK